MKKYLKRAKHTFRQLVKTQKTLANIDIELEVNSRVIYSVCQIII